MNRNAKKTKNALLLGVLIFILTLVLGILNPLQVVQWKITDLFFKSRGVSDQITIIAIDDKSIDQTVGLGRFRDWPRTYYSQLLTKLSQFNPKVVALDLDFRQGSKGISDPRLKDLLQTYDNSIDWYGLLKLFISDKHPDDVTLQKALDESTVPVVLIDLLTSQDVIKEKTNEVPKISGVILPIFKLAGKVSAGYVNLFYDRDGVARHFMPRVGNYKSFGLAIAEAFTGSAISTPDEVQAAIRYTAPPLSYKMISFVDVLSGQFKPEDIKDKIVLIGATAAILQDTHSTPTSRVAMPGVEIDANIVAQLIGGNSVKEQGNISLAFVLLIVAILGCFVFFVVELRYAAVVFILGLVVFPIVAYTLYQNDIVLNVVYPEIAWVFCMVVTLWYRSRTEFREKREIQKAFAHYVSPVVVNELAKDPMSLRLGGKREIISVMFSDIVGFTTLAEKLTPEDTVALLNDYLTAMTEVIFTYSGTLDKYQGDAIMALYGAPLADEHHALNACHAALNMRRALISLHEKWGQIPDLPFKEELIQLDFRVGISTGAAVVGNVGSEKRFDYTAIGDIVNLGSRLESVNRRYGTRVLVDKETFTQITQGHNPFVFRKLDIVRVKGKKQETEIFELIAQNEHVTQEMKSMLDDFESGRILYVQRNFGEAKQYFESALNHVADDSPSKIYLNRCNFYIRKPPNRDWDPIVNLEEK